MTTPTLDAFSRELASLKEASSLLEDLWLELDHLALDRMDPKLRARLENFFDFDDSV